MSPDSATRVVVTGCGVRSAIDQLDDAWSLMERGEHRVSWQQLSSEGSGIRCVGVLGTSGPPTEFLTQPKWLKYMGPQTQLAVWAAGRAITDAGLTGDENKSYLESMALMLATGPIAFELSDVLPALLASRGEDSALDFTALGVAGLRCSSPMMPFHTLLNMPIGLISMIFGMKGHNAIFYPDAEQALFAFASTVRAIQHGRVSTALVGGTAHLLSLMPIASYQRRGYLAASPEAARPFVAGHRGCGLGNAAGMVVLESESQARARGARVYGVLDVEQTLLSMAELMEYRRADRKATNLTLVTGTLSDDQDEEARTLSGDALCRSLDSVTGFTGPASVALNLAVACRLLDAPGGVPHRPCLLDGAIEVLCANTIQRGCEWGRLRLEAAS